MLGTGLYSLAEIADLTGLHYSRIRAWVTRDSGQAGLVVPAYGNHEDGYTLSFLDLVEILVAGQLREHGVSMQSVRKVHAAMQLLFDEQHPFALERLLTDGHRVFQHAVDQVGRDHVLDVLDRQHVIPEVLLPHLQKLDYDPQTHLASRWHIATGIVVDPKRSFGKPIVADVGVPVHVLAAAYEANDNNAARVASWYEITSRDVLDAVNFMKSAA